MFDPIIKTIEIPCCQEQAFAVFVNEIDPWWPLAKFSVSAIARTAAKLLHVEAKQAARSWR